MARSQRALVHGHARATEYRFEPDVLNALQASLASYLGHLKRASSHRLVASIWAAHPWLQAFLALDMTTLRLRRRDKAPAAARTVLAQYRHWQDEFAGDVVLMQIGAFVERLQWPPRRLPKVNALPAASHAVAQGGLRRMRPTRRGAVVGFPLAQLQRRVLAILASGRPATFIGQAGETGGRVAQRLPVARWVAGPAPEQ